MGFSNLNELINFLPNTNKNNNNNLFTINNFTINNFTINNKYVNVPLVLKKKKNKLSHKIYKNNKNLKIFKGANHLLKKYITKQSKKIKSDKLESKKIISDKINSEKINSDKIKSDKLKSDKLKSDKIKSDKIKSDKIKSEIKIDFPSLTTKEEVYNWSKTTKHEIQLRIDNELSAQLLNFELDF